MESYYDEILDKIRRLMSEKNIQEAYRLLEDELSMPYIPKESEEQLILLYQECRSALRTQMPQRTYEEEDIETLLAGSFEEQLLAIEQLKKSNVRNYLEAIEHCLMKDPDGVVRSLLIDCLMQQDIAEEMHAVVDGMELTFLPNYLEPVMKAEGARLGANMLCEWFEHEDPSFLTMCMECLIQECYLHLPFHIDVDEGIPLAISIVYYVKKAQGDETGFERFLRQHNLERENGFALLLERYGI